MAEETQQTQQTEATFAAPDKFQFTDAEVKENFPKMFPGMKSWEDAAKTMIHQQRKIGQQGVPLPAKPEEFVPWAQTHLKAPKDGKGYNFDKMKFPEGLQVDKVALQEFAETFAQTGMTQHQVDNLLPKYYEVAAKQQQLISSKRNEEATASKLALQKEWGVDFDKNLGGAFKALNLLGGEKLVKAVTESGLNNNLEFVKSLHTMAGMMKEDPISGKMSGGGFAAGPQQADQEIEMLRADPAFMKQYNDPNDPGYKFTRDRLNRLYKVKHGEIKG